MSHVLIVDDEPSICWGFRQFLGDAGHDVSVAASAEEGLRLAAARRPDAVVLDVRLPGMDGLTALRRLRETAGNVPVVVITAFGNLETAVQAVREGAFDYLPKPFDLDQAAAVVDRALAEGRDPPPPPDAERVSADLGGSMIGSSRTMQQIFKQIALVAATDVPVLVTGESGTGKELVARAIHRHGRRHERNFLAICLAALSPGVIESELFGHVKGAFTGATQDRTGLLELASGGTVLLDEIGDAPGALQVKLLRALEQREITPVGGAQPRPVDVRIVAATNRALPEMIRSGEFREDLFFRLSVFHIHLPPLRERPEDIPDLARSFLARCRPHAEEARLSDDVLDELESRDWPGNVRELRNVVEHAAVLARGSAIRLEHLPAPGVPGERPRWADEPDAEKEMGERIADWARRAARSGTTGGPALHERFLELVEAPLLKTVLDHCGGNRAAASQVLGIHRATLRQKLRRYGME